jgi:hypothetical protein
VTALSPDEPYRRDDEPAWTDWFGGPAREVLRELAPADTGGGALGVPNSVTPIEIFDGDRRPALRPGTKTTAEARRVPRRA